MGGIVSLVHRQPEQLVTMQTGGFVPKTRFHRLHEGELVVPKNILERDLLPNLDKLPATLKKKINMLMKRRPTRVSNKEIEKIAFQEVKERSLKKKVCKNGTQKKAKPGKAKRVGKGAQSGGVQKPRSQPRTQEVSHQTS